MVWVLIAGAGLVRLVEGSHPATVGILGGELDKVSLHLRAPGHGNELKAKLSRVCRHE
jgi:hypothetical protein